MCFFVYLHKFYIQQLSDVKHIARRKKETNDGTIRFMFGVLNIDGQFWMHTIIQQCTKLHFLSKCFPACHIQIWKCDLDLYNLLKIKPKISHISHIICNG